MSEILGDGEGVANTAATVNAAAATDGDKKAQIDYYRMRLEQTLDHTLRYSRLIYMVNGGALALMLGVAEFDSVAMYRDHAIWIGLLLIGVINIGHGLFVKSQKDWVSAFDGDYRETVGLDKRGREDRTRLRRLLGGTHAIYAKIHYFVGLVALLCCLGVGFLLTKKEVIG
ncbi:MAG: hypothetical protein JSU63_19710 [Phycisphaerales bacterium]|nr:MAG: hypothetical protein JSU63_19710 [Phycisphaerales bacterium]